MYASLYKRQSCHFVATDTLCLEHRHTHHGVYVYGLEILVTTVELLVYQSKMLRQKLVYSLILLYAPPPI